MANLAPQYADDASLKYDEFRWRWRAGKRLRFDFNYRLAHLPLVSPQHPLCVDGADYAGGRYSQPRYSLIAPIDFEVLAASQAFIKCELELRNTSFARKIDWDLIARRKSKTHITLAGGLPSQELSGVLASAIEFLRMTGSVSFRLKGPYIGSKNTGRLYFPVYPEWRTEGDCFASLQVSIGRQATKFYAIGYYNLVDELDERESEELHHFLEKWRNEILVQSEVREVCILETNDDLVLESKVVDRASTNADD